ncbi:MAG: glycosyltransferase family 2 protein [Acinetobacter sp.]
MIQLSILIVNYNTETFIESLLIDLKEQSIQKNAFEIIIVNNVQNTLLNEVIEKNTKLHDLNIKIISSEKNVGFGRAMNLAAAHAEGAELLIGNPDLRMLQTDYLEQLLKHAKQHQNYGVITTRQLNDDDKDTSEYKNYEFGQNLGYENQTNWLCGALLLIQKTVFDQISGFDPDFFMYCEDEDLCLRVKKLDLPLIKINELKIYHKGGSSEPLKDYAFYHRWFKSKILFAYKHYPTDVFHEILNTLEKKSTSKARLYGLIALSNIKKYQSRKDKWNAMKDCIQKTKAESVDWLYFKSV